MLGRYVLCCWSDDYGYELCPDRKPFPLRLHFHNCVFSFRFLYVVLLLNFVGDSNMISLFSTIVTVPLVSIVMLLNICPSQPLKYFFSIFICNPGFYSVVQFKVYSELLLRKNCKMGIGPPMKVLKVGLKMVETQSKYPVLQ